MRSNLMSRLWPKLLMLAACSVAARGRASDPAELARRIDERLSARWSAERVQPAPPADDCEFLRRAYLDLAGRIPHPADVYEFMADKSVDKRSRLIDRLLDEPR